MGLLDKLLKSPAEDILSKRGNSGAEAEDPLASVQEMYGLPATPPSAAPQEGPVDPQGANGVTAAAPQIPAAQPVSSPVPSPTPPSPVVGGAGAQASPPAGTQAEADDGSDTLDSPLRDLFTEAAGVDPMLQSLLARVGEINARDLADELKQFAKSVGAE